MSAFSCPQCKKSFSDNYNYCPHCGYKITSSTQDPLKGYPHDTQPSKTLFNIDSYQVVELIGKGGMGEIFRAYDPTCGRYIAIKRIREDLKHHKIIYDRFLHEARITCLLSHPAIVPIYTINAEGDQIYYTMPFIKGDTLKQILRETSKRELSGDTPHPIGSSITSLIRIFISICHAVAFAHSRGILHRDLKAENIILGTYGETLILDWGIAKMINDNTEEQLDYDLIEADNTNLTIPGKVIGTVSHMAPERAMGEPANFSTDIYALGIILYQMLALNMPFQRKNLKETRKNVAKEKFISPSKIAPDRDIPESLVRIVAHCLKPDPQKRYKTIEHLLHDLENYLEGRSDWLQVAKLNINNLDDWEFQENVVIAKYLAISQGRTSAEWVSLMISKFAFPGNIKIQAKVNLRESSRGVGFLLSIPEPMERKYPTDGYCLWLGSQHTKNTRLIRSTVSVVSRPDIVLETNKDYNIAIEKVDNNIYLFIDDKLQFSYICNLPLSGSHIGFTYEDVDFDISDLIISEGNINLTLGCLAIPDAFLSSKNHEKALTEYRRIYNSFPWSREGREALFRAGITLLDYGRLCNNQDTKDNYFQQALTEFEKLRHTKEAPLEYLGKSLVYQETKEYEEEIKCLEIAFRKYPKHPLLNVLEEQVTYRLHESSQLSRTATYRFMLLIIKVLPHLIKEDEIQKLFNNVEQHWETLPFIINDNSINNNPELKKLHLATILAFWLSKPYNLEEILDDILNITPINQTLVNNVILCWIELGAYTLAKNKIEELSQTASLDTPTLSLLLNLTNYHLNPSKEALQTYLSELHNNPLNIIEHLLNHLINTNKPSWITEIIPHKFFTPQLHPQLIWAALMQNDTPTADNILQEYPLEEINQNDSLLHFLYGCWLMATEGREISSIHFSGFLNVPYPRSWALFTHLMTYNIADTQAWIKRLFSWERRQLYSQAALYYRCANDNNLSNHYQELLLKEYNDVPVW